MSWRASKADYNFLMKASKLVMKITESVFAILNRECRPGVATARSATAVKEEAELKHEHSAHKEQRCSQELVES